MLNHSVSFIYWYINYRDELTDLLNVQNGSGHQSGSESDHSSVMELNEKLLEAHKKVVQQKLNKEVARDFTRVG